MHLLLKWIQDDQKTHSTVGWYETIRLEMNALLVTLTTRKWPQASKWNSSGPGSICRSCHELGLTGCVCEYGQAIVAIPLLGNFNYNRLHRLVWVILWHITLDDSFKAHWRTFSLTPKRNLKFKSDLLIPTLKPLPASSRLWSGETIIVPTFSFSQWRKIILVIPLKLVKCHFCVFKEVKMSLLAGTRKAWE